LFRRSVSTMASPRLRSLASSKPPD
jgi:hypothetical protein